MSGAPGWKVYDSRGEYRAACKYAEEAACLVALLGDGATIRNGHRSKVWTEGAEEQSAAESYDFVAERCRARCRGEGAK